MRLVSEAIVLTNDNRRIELRPSLRAAYRLHSKHGLFALQEGILEGNISIILDIVAEGHADSRGFVLTAFTANGAMTLINMRPALLAFLRECFGLQAASDQPTGTPAKPETWEETFTRLFGYATGWLHWTPNTAWQATPAEIMVAFNAHVEQLQAIHGTSDKDKTPHDPQQEVSATEVKSGLATLRALA